MKKLIIIILYAGVSILAQSSAELIDIGQGGVSGISKNGQFVCGSNYPNPPFVWSQATGRISLGTVDGEAYGVSNNGIVVGRFRDSSLTIGGEAVLRAGYWANNQWNGFEGITGVPPLDPQSFTHAYGINSEGTKTVGMVWHPNWRVEACYWSIPDTGIGLLGQAGNFNSRANVISNDESIIAGWDGIQAGPDRRAFYWDYQPHFMGGFDPTYLVGECRGMNSDGSVIVGGSVWPFIWAASNGMQHVVADSSIYFDGQAIGISDNGIIVGYVRFSVGNYRAFVKKPGWNDILLLEDFIPDSLGITSFNGWYFAFGESISADGNRIGLSAIEPVSGLMHALVLIIDTAVPVEVDVNPVAEFHLNQNYPNPFNPSTRISFTIPKEGNVKLSVFNILGEKVAELINEVKVAGTHNVDFNASELTSGIYLYRLEASDFVQTRKMTLIK